MSPLDGLDVLEFLYTNKIIAETIMLTSHTSPQILKGSINYKVSNFIEKPLDPNVLIDTFSDLVKIIDSKEKKAQLEEIGKISATILHDIRNPLSVIMGTSTLAKRRHETQPDLMKFANSVEKQSNQILNIINNIQNGLSRQDFYPTKTNLKELEQLLQEFMEYKQHKCNFNITFEQADLNISQVSLYQILTNLINNSLDAISDQPELEQWISIESINDNEGFTQIKFTDSGSGVPEEYAPHIFDRLFSKKKRDIGTGLGLFIIKELIEKTGESIQLNQNNSNTQFIISLKRTDAKH
jgi:signal transduction histidine kinase